ncbi:hypothetical protein DIURU_003187 [Diutina rugosa]|uniref:Carnitine O-acetyltransferase, mitochondrial n=1 Tax=Diutina rugosa TaxID=5481 RepID=A0A642UM29_DIURU|nr:uncharacterized protein DIURU_003187 [Diutina rugosa]KAA8901478.1 hypothetical protein DIURU_003187 [Diutina rugosa]
MLTRGTQLLRNTTTATKLMPTVIRQKNFSTSGPRGDLYKYQKDLPKLPVPPLNDTVTKYLKSVEPYLTPEQLAETTAKAQAFVKGQGEQLQSRLQKFAADKDNWLAEWWDDYAYLAYRDPVVPGVSYFFSHKDLTNAIGQDQLLKATVLTYHTINFMYEVNTENLEPEVIKGNPFCMNAFRYMFNNSRVPAEGADVTKLFDPAQHQYFVVAYKNNFYKVPHTVNGQRLTKAQLYNHFQAIKNSASQPAEVAIGALTSMNRDELWVAYQNLLVSPINEASLETIHASAFIICLDDTYPVTIEDKSKMCWHGDGKNRWFDKPVEYFVAANGNSGFLGEHSKMDATPTVQMNNYVYDQIKKEDPAKLIAEIQGNFNRESVEKLQWDINSQTRATVAKAELDFAATLASLDHETFQFYGYGKNQIKKFKTSPDAYVQMMMQLAYYKLTGKVRPTYESAATRKYLNGRTETGRVVSNESKAFVETWCDPNATNEEKTAKFQAAAKQHVAYLSAAADGHGVDRHLFGLKNMLQPGEPVPEFFTDPVFNYSQTWYISSSQIPSENFQAWGWQQVIDDGFGLGYLVNADWLHVHISCRRGNGLSSADLKARLTESAIEMKQVLSSVLEPPKAKI